MTQQTKNQRELLKKENQLIWREAQEDEFQRIKKDLASSPFLKAYDTNANAYLLTYALIIGLGFVLAQEADKT